MDMRKRTLVPGQMTDMELNQQNRCPELSLLSQGNFSRMGTQSMVTSLGNLTNPEVQHLPDHGNGAMLYGRSQYNNSMFQRAEDIRVATVGNPSFSCMTTPSGSEQFLRNYGLIGMSADAYARNSHFVEEVGCPYKRRFTEGIPVNFQGLNSSASYQASNAPFNSRYCSPLRHLTRGDYMVQPLQPAGDARWLGQHVHSNSDNRGAWTWNDAFAGSTTHGDNVRGSSESLISGFHRYHARNDGSTSFQHPPSIMIQRFSHQCPVPQLHLQGGRDQNIRLPHITAATQRIPLSSSYGIMHQQSLELEPRQTRDVPLTDSMVYDPDLGCVVPETMFRHRSVSRMRVLQENEVTHRGAQAPNSFDIGDFSDLYRDMRLDIDHMSYEELLALEEQIGNVRTGLSEETIISQLKTRTSMPSARVVNLEDSSSSSEIQETDSCTICLDVINDGENIGVIDCGHYYHSDCLKQWLLIKNLCPICKSEALIFQGKLNNDGNNI